MEITGTTTIQTINGVNDGGILIIYPTGALPLGASGNLTVTTSTCTAGVPVFLIARNQKLVQLGPVMVPWTPVAFSAGNFTTDAGTWTVGSGDQLVYGYKIMDDMMFVAFTLNATTVATNPTQLRIAVPASKTAKSRADGIASVNDNGTGEVACSCLILNSGTYIQVKRYDGAAFAAATDATLVRGEIWFPIN